MGNGAHYEINIREYQSGNKKWTNPEKLETQGTQDEEKQQKHNTIFCQIPIYASKHKYDMSPPTGGKDESNIVFMRKW